MRYMLYNLPQDTEIFSEYSFKLEVTVLFLEFLKGVELAVKSIVKFTHLKPEVHRSREILLSQNWLVKFCWVKSTFFR